MTTLPDLSLIETRVLGVLVEKQHTVPDTYPLTLLALTAGCNQKTSRDPVLNATESEVQSTIDRLKTLTLVVESSGGRVMRYAQNVGRVLAIPSQAVALLAVLMLRGPQTPGELKQRTERIHRFGSPADVVQALDALTGRELVQRLERRPGQKEERYAQLVGGETEELGSDPLRGQTPAAGSDFEQRLSRLEAAVEDLRARLDA